MSNPYPNTRFLLVEDDPLIIRFFPRFMRMKGIAEQFFRITRHPQEALDVLQGEAHAGNWAILLDNDFDGREGARIQDGMGLIRALEFLPDIRTRIVFWTGNDQFTPPSLPPHVWFTRKPADTVTWDRFLQWWEPAPTNHP